MGITRGEKVKLYMLYWVYCITTIFKSDGLFFVQAEKYCEIFFEVGEGYGFYCLCSIVIVNDFDFMVNVMSCIKDIDFYLF